MIGIHYNHFKYFYLFVSLFLNPIYAFTQEKKDVVKLDEKISIDGKDPYQRIKAIEKNKFKKDTNDWINLSFQGHLLHLEIDRYGKNNVFFILHERDEKNRTTGNKCLFLTLKLEEEELVIDTLETHKLNCSLSMKKKGTFLLQLAEQLAKSLKLKKVSLLNRSRIHCPLNEKKVDLSFLHLMQTGYSWYESKGFVLQDKDRHESYRKGADELFKLKLDTTFSTIQETALRKKDFQKRRDQIRLENKNISSEKERKLRDEEEHYQRAIQVIDDWEKNEQQYMLWVEEYKIQSKKNDMAGFLSWVWNHHCDHFQNIHDILYPEYYPIQRIFAWDWWDHFFNFYHNVDHEWEKNLIEKVISDLDSLESADSITSLTTSPSPQFNSCGNPTQGNQSPK